MALTLSCRLSEADNLTRTGYRFHIRPVTEDDTPALQDLFARLTPDDLRFRFLSGVRRVPESITDAMTHVDHEHAENFLAYDPESGLLIASAHVAGDARFEVAEVAIAIDPAFKGRGVGWTMLEQCAAFARAQGFAKIRSIESRDNHAAIELEREMGFTAHAMPGEASLLIVEADLFENE